MKTIMILGGSILQVPAIKQSIDLGLNVVVCDINPEAEAFKIPGLNKEIVSTTDTKRVLKAAIKHNIDGIMTLASDMPMITVAAVSEKLNLKAIDKQTALNTTNKSIMRDVLKRNNIPIPIYYSASNFHEFSKAVNAISDLGYKCIVKPSDNSGSRGVHLIEDYDTISLMNVYNYTKQFSRSNVVMVEEFLEGPEVSVETITIDGKCNVIQITDKLTSGPPYFVEMGHSQPSLLKDDIKNQIKEIAILANNAVGIKTGPSHTELKITNDGPKIIEIGSRLGGDNITTHLTPLSTGIDLVTLCIKLALNENVQIPKIKNKASAIRYINSDYGIINTIDNVEDVKRIPGVVEINITRGQGTYFNGIHSSIDRVGYVITKANDVNDAIRIAEQAIDFIKIEMR